MNTMKFYDRSGNVHRIKINKRLRTLPDYETPSRLPTWPEAHTRAARNGWTRRAPR